MKDKKKLNIYAIYKIYTKHILNLSEGREKVTKLLEDYKEQHPKSEPDVQEEAIDIVDSDLLSKIDNIEITGVDSIDGDAI